MSNVLTQSPWLVDTAAATILGTGRHRIVGIRWMGGTTAGHQCIITDRNGKVVFEGIAAAANHNDESNIPFEVDGISVTTLGSGRVYIYFE